MKQTLLQAGDYVLEAEISDCYLPAGAKRLVLSSTYQNSNTPESRVMCDIILDQDSLAKFVSMLQTPIN
jgi:hypothetical protein